MDTRDLYNNPEDSDVKIKLSDGSLIYTHRVILKRTSDIFKKMLTHKLRESTEGIITFPEHTDQIVVPAIQHIYGLAPVLQRMSCDAWFALFYFAHLFEMNVLMQHMIDNLHSEARFKHVLTAAWELTQPQLLTKSLHLIVKTYLDNSELAGNEYVKGIARVDKQFMVLMQRQWYVEKLDPFILFMLNCKICDRFIDNNDNNDNINNIIEHTIAMTDFTQFDASQLLACLNIPHIAKNSAYVKLITCIMHLVSFGKKKQQPLRNARRRKNANNQN